MGSIPGLGKSPGKKKWQPTPVFFPGDFHGQRSLPGYCPWGRKESDITEVIDHGKQRKCQSIICK